MVGGMPGIGPRGGAVAGATARGERGIISAERRATSLYGVNFGEASAA